MASTLQILQPSRNPVALMQSFFASLFGFLTLFICVAHPFSQSTAATPIKLRKMGRHVAHSMSPLKNTVFFTAAFSPLSLALSVHTNVHLYLICIGCSTGDWEEELYLKGVPTTYLGLDIYVAYYAR